jgi:hypothetical protein
MNRQLTARGSTSTVPPAPSSIKIEKDIIKHASRIRRISPSKDQLTKSTGVDTIPSITSPRSNANNRQQSAKKPSKSMSLVSCIIISEICVYLLSFFDDYDKYQWRESSN